MILNVKFQESEDSLGFGFQESDNSLDFDFGETGGGGVCDCPELVTDETLSYVNGVLSVNTAKEVAADNTLPVTSAAVATQVGNIEILLKTI